MEYSPRKEEESRRVINHAVWADSIVLIASNAEDVQQFLGQTIVIFKYLI